MAIPVRLNQPKTHKYHAKPVTIDGITFASTREGNRYCELKHLESAGEIKNLELQPQFRLTVRHEFICFYVADFRYRLADGRTVVEDVKGVRTAMYKLKRKLMKAINGIEILET